MSCFPLKNFYNINLDGNLSNNRYFILLLSIIIYYHKECNNDRYRTWHKLWIHWINFALMQQEHFYKWIQNPHVYSIISTLRYCTIPSMAKPICLVWFLICEAWTHAFASSTTPSISQPLNGTLSILISKWNCDKTQRMAQNWQEVNVVCWGYCHRNCIKFWLIGNK